MHGATIKIDKSVLIFVIIVHLLVIVQNIKRCTVQGIKIDLYD